MQMITDLQSLTLDGPNTLVLDSARLLFVGDISLGGEYSTRYGQSLSSMMQPFSEVMPIFRSADLRIGNLEDPLIRGKTPRTKKNLLGTTPESVAVLSALGFSVLNLGNNHITDQGAEGISKTRGLLVSKGIAPFGAGENLAVAGKPAFVTAGGQSFAFLGYAEPGRDVGAEMATDSREGCVPLCLERIGQDIVNARKEASHVVVSLHWGYQYDRYPESEQVAMARKIIDLGALIVYGHHPHVVQGMECYKQGLIMYSLGNFFFANFARSDGVKWRFPRESFRTVAVCCDVGESGIHSFSTIPLGVDRDFRVRVLQGRAAARAKRSLALISSGFDSPDYSSCWQSHHGRTERKRRQQEELMHIQTGIIRVRQLLRKRGVASAMKNLGVLYKEVSRFVRHLVGFLCL